MTSLPLPQLQSLLLDFLSPIRTVDPLQLKALNADDWSRLLKMIRQHRLGPLMHWQLMQKRANLPLPDTMIEEFQQSFRRASMHALEWQRELVLVHRILDRAAIPHMALKGAYLAGHAYPHPALRPLRDLDILVPRDQALAAYQALIDGGLSRISGYPGTPEACQHDKHFPPLRSPSGRVSVELHSRLYHPMQNGEAQTDLSATPGFWTRSIDRQVANHALPFTSPTDLLLHLIVHAVFDHQFNNGPLLLSDIAFLLEKHEIDWPLFWSLAEQGQHRRGCLLALKLMERHWGKRPIAWPADIDADIDSLNTQLESATLLILRDFDVRIDVNLAKEIAQQISPVAKICALIGKLFVPKRQIAATYPVAEHSLLLYFWYPVRWWRLATQRMPEYLRVKRQAHVDDEISQLTALERWLANSK